jgi:hypothetical protein
MKGLIFNPKALREDKDRDSRERAQGSQRKKNSRKKAQKAQKN